MIVFFRNKHKILKKMGINITLVITFIFVFALCITEDNAGIVLKNFKSRRTMMEELEKEAKEKAFSAPSSIDDTKNLIKSKKVPIKSKIKSPASTRKLLKSELSSEVKNISKTEQVPKANLKDKDFPKLDNSFVVYVNNLKLDNRQEKRKPKSLATSANAENLKQENISDLSEPKVENNSLNVVNSSQQHDTAHAIIPGNLNLSEINQLRDLNELTDKTKEKGRNSTIGNDPISTSERNNPVNSTLQKSDAFIEEHAESLIHSEAKNEDEAFKAKNTVPDKFDDDLIKFQNFSNEVNISESKSLTSDHIHKLNHTNLIIGKEKKENQKTVGELDNTIQKLNESKTSEFIQEPEDKTWKDGSSVTKIHSDLGFKDNIQNDTVSKKLSNVSVTDKTDLSNNTQIEVKNETSSTGEPLISDEFNVKKFMETLKEIVIDDIDQDLQFEPVASGNLTQPKIDSFVGSFIPNNLSEVFQEEPVKITMNDSFETKVLTSEPLLIDLKLNYSEVLDMENITKENNDSSDRSEKAGSTVETFIATFSNQSNNSSESVSSGLDILMNSEVAKNAIDVFNISDSSITDHVIEDSDFHSIIDLMLPSLPVLEEQVSPKEKLNSPSIDSLNSTDSIKDDFEIKFTDSIKDVNEKTNESFVVLANTTASLLESVSNTANVTDTSSSKCPIPGICVFWFMARDTCFDDSQCLGSKLCCRIRCSKQCVDV